MAAFASQAEKGGIASGELQSVSPGSASPGMGSQTKVDGIIPPDIRSYIERAAREYAQRDIDRLLMSRQSKRTGVPKQNRRIRAIVYDDGTVEECCSCSSATGPPSMYTYGEASVQLDETPSRLPYGNLAGSIEESIARKHRNRQSAYSAAQRKFLREAPGAGVGGADSRASTSAGDSGRRLESTDILAEPFSSQEILHNAAIGGRDGKPASQAGMRQASELQGHDPAQLGGLDLSSIESEIAKALEGAFSSGDIDLSYLLSGSGVPGDLEPQSDGVGPPGRARDGNRRGGTGETSEVDRLSSLLQRESLGDMLGGILSEEDIRQAVIEATKDVSPEDIQGVGPAGQGADPSSR